MTNDSNRPAEGQQATVPEESTPTDLQRAEQRRQDAERERDAARAEAARLAVAVKYGITEGDAELMLTGADPATLATQAERLLQIDAERPATGNYVASEGGNPDPRGGNSELRQFINVLFDRPPSMW